MTNYYVQQDDKGQWWRVTEYHWQNIEPRFNVIEMKAARPCTVPPGIIAVLDLAGEEVDVPGVGYLEIPVEPDSWPDVKSPVYLLNAKYCPLEKGK